MKIVAFNGSPRKGGNTELLIKEEFYKLKYCSTVVYMVPRA